MDVISQVTDREIPKAIDITVAAFAPLLKAQRNLIKAIPQKTFTYGATERHKLDVYYPLTATTGNTPVLFFIYGGGFNTGERSMSPKTFGLVYACVGAFYARRGYIVVIPDYRLVPHVVFPGGGEDVRDAVRWVTHNRESLISTGSPSPDTDTLVLMGHSAGAVHVATAIFSTDVIPENDELRSKIVAIVLLSPPYDLSAMTNEWPNAHIHEKYWGTLDESKANDPLHLYRRLPDSTVKVLPKILMVEGEMEPEWLIDAGIVFREEVKKRTGEELKKIVGRGHNHISLNWALSTGQGEEWAEEAVEWLRNIKE